MIEDRKEGILGFFGFGEEMNVVHDQYIDQLIEMNEIEIGRAHV